MVHLVSLGTAGLSDDLLHVLNLALAAGEGAELEKNEVSVWFEKVRDQSFARRLDQWPCLGRKPCASRWGGESYCQIMREYVQPSMVALQESIPRHDKTCQITPNASADPRSNPQNMP